jgi:hypothetical protein
MPMLRPFIKDRTDYGELERVREFGAWVKKVTITDSALRSDLAVLPMSWNYYRVNKRERLAVEFVSEARRAGLPILTWTSGDFGVAPLDKDVYVLRCSGYLSKKLPKHFALPVFVKDPLQTYFSQSEPILYPKTETPVVGFCGLAHAAPYRVVYEMVRTAARNIKFHVGLSPYEPQRLYPATLTRARALSLIRDRPEISDNFVVRKAYRAGARTPQDIQRTKMEYFKNMADSGYIVCVRGRGNFSARLYETLAMGRIPIIVDTDCLYPYSELIEWKNLGVWVEAKKLHTLPDKILEFHARSTDEAFTDLQRQARQVWLEKLSLSGYFGTLVGMIGEGRTLRL